MSRIDNARRYGKRVKLAFEVAPLSNAAPETLIDAVDILQPWALGSHKAGDVRAFGGVPYLCKQDHTAADPNHTPDKVPAQWTRIARADEIPAWSAGSWAKDAKVTHKGKTWVSQVDNNTWEPGGPGVYDNIWKEVTS